MLTLLLARFLQSAKPAVTSTKLTLRKTTTAVAMNFQPAQGQNGLKSTLICIVVVQCECNDCRYKEAERIQAPKSAIRHMRWLSAKTGLLKNACTLVWCPVLPTVNLHPYMAVKEREPGTASRTI